LDGISWTEQSSTVSAPLYSVAMLSADLGWAVGLGGAIVEWDGKPIGDGKPGPVARALRDILMDDMRSARERLIDVPY
jgi:hypothetical protein